eukprot:91111-Chlamydomonas_euryale.AAC.9
MRVRCAARKAGSVCSGLVAGPTGSSLNRQLICGQVCRRDASLMRMACTQCARNSLPQSHRLQMADVTGGRVHTRDAASCGRWSAFPRVAFKW